VRKLKGGEQGKREQMRSASEGYGDAQATHARVYGMGESAAHTHTAGLEHTSQREKRQRVRRLIGVFEQSGPSRVEPDAYASEYRLSE